MRFMFKSLKGEKTNFLNATRSNKYSLSYCFELCVFLYTQQVKAKLKQSNYRPGQDQSYPEGWGSLISRQSAHEGGKIISPTHRPPLPPGSIPGTHFCWRLSRPHGRSAARRIISMKNSNDTIGNCNLPTCSAVPQPTPPRRAPFKVDVLTLSPY